MIDFATPKHAKQIGASAPFFSKRETKSAEALWPFFLAMSVFACAWPSCAGLFPTLHNSAGVFCAAHELKRWRSGRRFLFVRPRANVAPVDVRLELSPRLENAYFSRRGSIANACEGKMRCARRFLFLRDPLASHGTGGKTTLRTRRQSALQKRLRRFDHARRDPPVTEARLEHATLLPNTKNWTVGCASQIPSTRRIHDPETLHKPSDPKDLCFLPATRPTPPTSGTLIRQPRTGTPDPKFCTPPPPHSPATADDHPRRLADHPAARVASPTSTTSDGTHR
jgi:hypothetical protein